MGKKTTSSSSPSESSMRVRFFSLLCLLLEVAEVAEADEVMEVGLTSPCTAVRLALRRALTDR